MSRPLRLGVLMLLLAGCTQSDPVPGWRRATELKPSLVPYTQLPVNEVVALGDGGWSFNGVRVEEAHLLTFARDGAALLPQPVLLVDFSRIHSAAEKRRLMAAIAHAAGCTGEYSSCIEGTRAEYDRF